MIKTLLMLLTTLFVSLSSSATPITSGVELRVQDLSAAFDAPNQSWETPDAQSRRPEAFNCVSLPAGIGAAAGFVLGAGICGSCCLFGGVIGASSLEGLAASAFGALIGAGAGGLSLGAVGGLGGAFLAKDKAPKKKTKKSAPRVQPDKSEAPPPKFKEESQTPQPAAPPAPKAPLDKSEPPPAALPEMAF